MILISVQAFPPRSGGIQTLMAGLAHAASQNNDVIVFADKKSESASKFDAQQSYRVKRFDGFKFLRQRKKAKTIETVIKTETVTHLICDSWKSAERLSRNLKSCVIIYAHGNEFPKNHQKLNRIKNSLAKADHIIAVSSQTAERLRPFLLFHNAPKVHVMPNPVDAPVLATDEDRKKIDALWPKYKTRLLSLCRLIDWKGVDRAILAVKACKAQGKPVHLIIAGDGDDEPRLRRLIEQNRLDDNVTFIGRIEGGRKTALYQSANIYIQAGRTENDQCEGFGISYIEAALQGLPSIAGRDGGAPDAVLHEKTGLVVNGDTQENVSAAVMRLIDEPALASHMGSEAQKRAQDLLWDKQIIRVLNLNKEFED